MAVSQLAPVDRLDAYRSMFTIRRFEERVPELRRADQFAGSTHVCAGQIAARSKRYFGDLDARVKRVGALDVRLPPTPALQAAVLPSAASIAQAAKRLALEE
jgi:hypothetical protein